MENIVIVLRRNLRRIGREENDGFLRLFVSKRLLQGAATAILGIFVPIFLYEVTGSQFYIVGLYYAVLSVLYVVLLVPGMYVTNKIGFSRALVVGGLFCVVVHSILFFITAENWLYLIVPLTISIIGFRVFHWVPFHVDFTLFTKDGERGRQVSLSFATIAFLGVVGPILAGFIIANAGYGALFGTAVVLLLAATISYAFVPETATRFEWTWRETWQRFVSRDMRSVVVGEFANGAETIVNVIVWPIFLYEILDGDVFEIGAVSTIVVGTTILIQLFLGRHLDRQAGAKERMLRIGSSLYAFGWILKIFVISTAQVFFVGLYHNIVKIFTKTPFSAILYDMSAEQGKYVDEFTVLREMAMHCGRAASLIIISGLTLIVPIGWTFIIAAAASIALNMVYRIQTAG